MTRHPKPDLAAMSGSVFMALVAILTGLSIFAQCTRREPRESIAEVIDTGAIIIDTCQPWPQCVEPEPPKRLEGDE